MQHLVSFACVLALGAAGAGCAEVVPGGTGGVVGVGGMGGTGGVAGVGGVGDCIGEPCTADRPILTSIEQALITLNACGLPGSTFEYTVEYSDPDGDVTAAGVRVFVALVFSTGDTQSYESLGPFNTVTGDGFTGSVSVRNCVQFGNATWVAVSVTIEDASGNLSNSLTIRIDKPEGAS